MVFYALLAFATGLLITVAHSLNTRLAAYRGSFFGSFMNNFIALIFLALIFFIGQKPLTHFSYGEIPLYAYAGGLIGGVFVAIFINTVRQLGVIKTVIIVTSLQLISGMVFTLVAGQSTRLWAQLLGASLILLGLVWGREHQSRRS